MEKGREGENKVEKERKIGKERDEEQGEKRGQSGKVEVSWGPQWQVRVVVNQLGLPECRAESA